MPDPELSPLRDLVVLITGASSGIGRALAVDLARHGAPLGLAGRRPDALADTAALLPAGSRSGSFPVDLTDDDQARTLVRKVETEFGRLDVVVHCAATYHQGPLETTSVDALDDQYRTNVRAPYVLTQAALPLLKRAKGQIVFVNSTTGLVARPFVTGYAASKHALKGLADSLRHELADHGVRVISVYPGQTATPMQAKRYAFEERPYEPAKLIQPEDVATMIRTVIALPRTADVTDVQVRPGLRS
ncbi:MAG TPA: SDR family NAD(P)-dependent oxidoreductase [Tepidisphaeraceae bacterium]|nr:SDR family NAD(P)-dependent oxidoreductase [Tepidisphaeraceae bacterium]